MGIYAALSCGDGKPFQPKSNVTPTQRVRIAILCALEFYAEPEWNFWARCWLSGDYMPWEDGEPIYRKTCKRADERADHGDVDPAACAAIFAMDAALQLNNGCDAEGIHTSVACSLFHVHEAIEPKRTKRGLDPLAMLRKHFDLVDIIWRCAEEKPGPGSGKPKPAEVK